MSGLYCISQQLVKLVIHKGTKKERNEGCWFVNNVSIFIFKGGKVLIIVVIMCRSILYRSNHIQGKAFHPKQSNIVVEVKAV